jgi:nucleoside phosphorylase
MRNADQLMPDSTLVCFALQIEATPFCQLIKPPPNLRILLTGIGQDNARQTIRRALTENLPKRVLTCGFAGGLNPVLPFGAIVFETDPDFDLTPALLRKGARPVRFHCVTRVVSTRVEKESLWHTTRADAVEMESGIIRQSCREYHVPCATARVISDTAAEDLPLDFNHFLTAGRQMNYGKLVWALMKSPGQIKTLRQFHHRLHMAANKLAEALAGILAT